MNDYIINKYFQEEGNTLEEIILNYFNIYLDINNDIYE